MVMASNNGSSLQCSEDSESRTRALLQSEIRFWRDLIGSSPATQSADSMERMRHALELAEMRLANLSVAYRETGATGGARASNIYCLDTRRGDK